MGRELVRALLSAHLEVIHDAGHLPQEEQPTLFTHVVLDWLCPLAGPAKAITGTGAQLCLFGERWPGPWLHVEGEAAIERLPEAMPLLADYHRRRGQDTTTEAFRERVLSENRVLIGITPQRVVGWPAS